MQASESSMSSTKKYTLEQKLFHEIHRNDVHQPTVKEFKEALAFVNATKSFFGRNAFDLILDVAGGHGALAALFLIMTSASTAVVIDPAKVGGGGVERAWRNFYEHKNLRYRHEPLQMGLPAELSIATKRHQRDRILVVGCHACQHLSEDIIEISRRYNVQIAVMPCCQKDQLPGSPWKSTSKLLGIPFATTMDILLAGKALSSDRQYDVRMKLIDSDITPQNRLILCKRNHDRDTRTELAIAKATKDLERAYWKAHRDLPTKDNAPESRAIYTLKILGPFCAGIACGIVIPCILRLKRSSADIV